MGRRPLDLKDKQFGFLSVLERLPRPLEGEKNYRWVCRCVCNKVICVPGAWLKGGRIHSCGCMKHGRLLDKDPLKKLDKMCEIMHYSNKKHRGRIGRSGVCGVTWDSRLSKWRINIIINSENIYLGVRDDINAAIKLRNQAESKLLDVTGSIV